MRDLRNPIPRVREYLKSHGGEATLAAIAKAENLPPSIVRRVLFTLEKTKQGRIAWKNKKVHGFVLSPSVK